MPPARPEPVLRVPWATKHTPCLLICVVRSPHSTAYFMAGIILGTWTQRKQEEGIQRGMSQEHLFISGHYGPKRRICSMGQSDQWELSVPESPTVETDKEQIGGDRVTKLGTKKPVCDPFFPPKTGFSVLPWLCWNSLCRLDWPRTLPPKCWESGRAPRPPG